MSGGVLMAQENSVPGYFEISPPCGGYYILCTAYKCERISPATLYYLHIHIPEVPVGLVHVVQLDYGVGLEH